jgi:hypothetical protein
LTAFFTVKEIIQAIEYSFYIPLLVMDGRLRAAGSVNAFYTFHRRASERAGVSRWLGRARGLSTIIFSGYHA